MYKVLSLIIVLLTSLPTSGTAFTVGDPARIHMVVWRGCESACEGFRRFFYDRDLPVKITVTNVGKDKSKLIKIRETLIAEKPDLVVTWGTSVSVGIIGTIKEFGSNTALGDIPVLFMIVADPVRSNIVESYTSSGRDFVTGVRNRVPEKTQIGLILQYFKPKKIGVINSPNEDNSKINTARLKEIAAQEEFEVVSLEYNVGLDGKPKKEEIPELMQQLRNEGAEAVYVGSSSFNLENRDLFSASAIMQRLPLFSAYAQMVQESGALMAVANAYVNVGKLAAGQAKRILFDRANPIDLPIVSLSRFSVFINANTAKQLELYPPIQLINIAKFVFGTEAVKYK
jgi:putative ABC transport system substrate-binding protein